MVLAQNALILQENLGHLDEALASQKPDIFNTDQGVQFTSGAFTGRLEDAGVMVSMDGRGRALDNVFVERLWWSLKYEHVYIHDHQTVPSLHSGPRRLSARHC